LDASKPTGEPPGLPPPFGEDDNDEDPELDALHEGDLDADLICSSKDDNWFTIILYCWAAFELFSPLLFLGTCSLEL
jgi:hypothetical protein